MSEAENQILKMLENGLISAEEADRFIVQVYIG